MAKLDFYTSLLLITLGVVVVVESLRMPRYAHLGVNPYTVPGLVPGLLGAVLVFFGILLLVRSSREEGWRPGGMGGVASALRSESARRALITLALTLGYGAILVGLLPFWLATFIFVFVFIALFDWRKAAPLGQKALRLGLALLQAALVAAIVTAVFERLFLVRLP
jgi:hypothetical protein